MATATCNATSVAIELRALRDAFGRVSRACLEKGPKPILGYVLFEFDGGSLKLSATSLEVAISDTVDCRGDVVVKAAIPAGKFRSILAESDGDEIELTVTDQSLAVKCGSMKCKVGCSDWREFPTIDSGATQDQCHEISGEALATLLARTEFACDATNARWAFGGVKLEFGKDFIRALSSDAHRLAVMQCPAVRIGDHAPPETTVLPSQAIKKLLPLLDGIESVNVSIRVNDVVVRAGTVTVVARMLEGRFPKVDSVLDMARDHVVSVPAGTILQAMRCVAIFTDAQNTGADNLFSNGTWQLSSQLDSGKCDTEIPIAFDGGPVKVRLAADYAIECLRLLEADELIEVRFMDADTPVEFRVGEYRYFIVPMVAG